MNSVLAMTGTKPPPQLAAMKPKTMSEKRTGTTLDTMIFTPEMIAKIKRPPGQRPLKVNSKVRELAEKIRQDGGVLPGIITLGKMDGIYYTIDGQHRLHAFLLSCCKEGFADVRLLHAASMKEIHAEFVELNSRLVQMRPDDFLRGMEDSVPALQQIRAICPFVGFDKIVRTATGCGPVVSMSAMLRSWRISAAEAPASASGGSAVAMAEEMVEEETRGLTEFLTLADDAFGRDLEFRPLWGSLNMILCMWLYRRTVITQYSPKTPRLDKATFKKCLLALSADSGYIDWLVGRRIGEHDRSPAYGRIKAIFAARLTLELGKKPQLPQPEWSSR